MRDAVSLRPASATWSRHGEMPRMPSAAQPAMMSGSFHCARTVAVLMDSSPGSGVEIIASAPAAVQGAQRLHPRHCKLGIEEQSSLVGQLEQLREMKQAARALLSADHDEMILASIEPGQEDDAGLVEARGCAEHMPRQRDGGR